MKPSVAEILRISLLLVIVLELGYISLQLPVGGVLPWPQVNQYSKLEGKIPTHENLTLGQTVAYTACAVETILKLQVASQIASRDTTRAK